MNFTLLFSLLLFIILLPDCYISFVVLAESEWWWKAIIFVPTFIYAIAILNSFLLKKNIHKSITAVISLSLLVWFSILIFFIISFIGWIIGLYNPVMFQIFNRIALGVTAAWIIAVLYGLTYGWKKITTKKYTLKYKNLPKAFNGYKIIHLSDLHIGTYLASPSTVELIVNKVNNLNPDLIVFTGDLVNNSAEEIFPFLKDLKELTAKDGIVSVLGNHDYCLYRKYDSFDSADKELEKVISFEKEAGWVLLLNESMEIKRNNEKIAVLGVENAGGKTFTDRSDLSRALTGLPETEFKILLSHDPSQWRREVLVKSNIELTLSGHTHAMQFKIGPFSPAKWFYKEWGGIYQEGDQNLIVNTGTGGNIAFRFGSYPQIVEISLFCN